MESCAICKREFNTLRAIGIHAKRLHELSAEDYYRKYIMVGSEGECNTCGNITTFGGLIKGFREHCSYKCSANNKRTMELRKKTLQKKYGVDNISQVAEIKQKKIDTSLMNNGVKHPMQSKIVREKSKIAVQKKYGVDNISQVDEIKRQKEETCLRNYGVKNILQSSAVRKTVEQNMMKKYGVRYYMQSPENYKKVMENAVYKLKPYTTKFGDVISYQSGHELKFVKKCENDDIRILDGDCVEYQVDGREHRYYVDFKTEIDNKYQLVEIKARHKWFYRDIKNGSLEAKCKAAEEYSEKSGYLPFRFILNREDTDYRTIL